ncbi:MAG TPA: hypothetical protein VK698_23685, partial [Kofleriaceae bacterium]|nr:hypothetical protein [Kofleriaceae bacterium]
MLTRPRRSTSLGGIVAVIASVVAGTAALVAVAPVAVAAPATWGGLVPGPYPVGFRQLEVRDPARPFRAARTLDGRARRGDQARPIRISLWYPATAASGEPLTVGDYAALMGVEDRLGPVTRERARIGERTFFAAELLRDLDPGQRQALLRLAGIARRGAPAAPGRFPIVLYSLGSAALGPITPEYLASHGYLVAQAPRLGATAGMPTDWRDELELLTRMADLDRVVAAVGALPQADPDALAAIGFSAGGRWALQAAMSNPHVRAVVSLDTVMLFDDDGGHAWRRYPAFDLEAVRVPVLHAIRAEWVPREDPGMWRAMRHADRTTLRFDDPALHHLDFQSVGLAMTLVGSRADRARSVRTAFDVWNRATLAFLDAHLAGARHGAGAR